MERGRCAAMIMTLAVAILLGRSSALPADQAIKYEDQPTRDTLFGIQPAGAGEEEEGEEDFLSLGTETVTVIVLLANGCDNVFPHKRPGLELCYNDKGWAQFKKKGYGDCGTWCSKVDCKGEAGRCVQKNKEWGCSNVRNCGGSYTAEEKERMQGYDGGSYDEV